MIALFCQQALLRMDKHIPKDERVRRVEKAILEVKHFLTHM
jgi:hypothetical protein